ncbi:MAG: phosphoribosyltransferase [Bacteroidota bacterium]|nr:phosphoribosyltransferase [Bacteroidota bacterium]
MEREQNLILKERQVLQMIKRIAYEIYERNFKETELVIAGIDENGYVLAKMLIEELKVIAPLKLILAKITIDKLQPKQSEVHLDISNEALMYKNIIITDDVLNTGRTLAFSLKAFLNLEVKKIETAILVNRGHTLFPIAADYYGYELSTTLKEHIEVNLSGNNAGVYLH